METLDIITKILVIVYNYISRVQFCNNKLDLLLQNCTVSQSTAKPRIAPKGYALDIKLKLYVCKLTAIFCKYGFKVKFIKLTNEIAKLF